jgi:hypothetical protein
MSEQDKVTKEWDAVAGEWDDIAAGEYHHIFQLGPSRSCCVLVVNSGGAVSRCTVEICFCNRRPGVLIISITDQWESAKTTRVDLR